MSGLQEKARSGVAVPGRALRCSSNSRVCSIAPSVSENVCIPVFEARMLAAERNVEPRYDSRPAAMQRLALRGPFFGVSAVRGTTGLQQ